MATIQVPWYKDKDVTRLIVGLGYLLVIIALIVFVVLYWHILTGDSKGVILPIIGSITTAAALALHRLAGEADDSELTKKLELQEVEITALQEELKVERAKREALEQMVTDLHTKLVNSFALAEDRNERV